MENTDTKILHDLMPYLKLENQVELITIIKKLPYDKHIRLVGFVNDLKLSNRAFSIYKITYESKTNMLTVDANFHLDSF